MEIHFYDSEISSSRWKVWNGLFRLFRDRKEDKLLALADRILKLSAKGKNAAKCRCLIITTDESYNKCWKYLLLHGIIAVLLCGIPGIDESLQNVYQFIPEPFYAHKAAFTTYIIPFMEVQKNHFNGFR